MIRIRHLTLATLAALAVAPTAFAQDSSDTTSTTTTTESASGKRFAVVGGYALSEPSNSPGSVAGGKSDFNGDGAPTLSASWYINDNVAVEAWGAEKFGHRMKLDGAKAGSVGAQPVAVSGQYHFRAADDTVRPFVGLGYYEMNISEERAEPSGALAGQRIGMSTPKGAMATAGVDFNITPTWFARTDLRYLHGSSDVELDGVKSGEVDLNPVVLGVGVGARF
ncbi:MAG TPA: OmpW family outer membrane protein [Lysobacter sp.]